MAEIMKNKGEILALDIYEHRIKLIEENSKRLGINIIKTNINDATKYEENYKEKFDKILLDVPCLGIGVLKRKPDIKWKKTKDDVEEISKVQLDILLNCSKYLKQNGKIVYSTCSIFKEENQNIIDKFLEKNKNFKIEKIKMNKENYFNKFITEKGAISIFQNEKTDGFFICKLIRK